MRKNAILNIKILLFAKRIALSALRSQAELGNDTIIYFYRENWNAPTNYVENKEWDLNIALPQ